MKQQVPEEKPETLMRRWTLALEKAEMQLMRFTFLIRHKSIRAFQPDYLSKQLQAVFLQGC